MGPTLARAALFFASFSAVALLGSPARAQCVQTLFSEDFETGAPGWTLSGNWVIALGLPCGPACAQGRVAMLRSYYGPPQCPCYAGNNPGWDPCEGELVSPPISLPAIAPGESLTLDFCLSHWVDGGCLSGIGDCNRLTIESATKIRTYSFQQGGWFNGCPATAILPPYDLAEFAGEVVTLRWIPACVDPEGGSSIIVDNVTVVLISGAPSSYCLTSPNSTGSGAVIGSTGLTSVAENQLFLTVDAAPPGQFGIFYFGDGMVQLPFGLGFRCVGGDIGRFVPALPISAGGTASQKVDFTLPPAAGKLIPGTTWFFQFWYRDPSAGGAGFNLSDGLQATFCQ